MLRKLARTALIAGLMFGLLVLAGGCGGKGQETQAPGGQAQQAEGKSYVAKLGTVEPVKSPKMEALNRFKADVEKATNGKVVIEIYPAQQLGTAREMIEGTQLGTIQAVLVPTSNFTGFEPAMSIFDLPFLFPSREVTYKVIDSEVGDELLGVLEKHGIKGVAFWESGFKQLTANFPIRGPEDYKGKKIRVMENPVLIAQYEALGASAIPINFGELYNSLQQGVVDGQENPIATIYEMKFYEVQKYMALSDHGYLPLVLGFNKKWFDELPAEYQQAIVKAAKENGQWLRERQSQLEKEEFLPAMEKYGLKISQLTPEARQAFAAKVREATRAKLNSLLDETGKQLLAKVDAKIQEVSGQ